MYELIRSSEYLEGHKKSLPSINIRNSSKIESILYFYSESEKIKNLSKSEFKYMWEKKAGKNINCKSSWIISECYDEWFFVKSDYSNFYYKCDQVEGVILLLKDLIDN